jgi:hypothetical protein
VTPVEPPELTARFTVDGPPEAYDAARAAAAPTGTARDAGPDATLLSGRRADVLAAFGDAVQAALDAGAHGIDVRLETPTEVRP